MGGDNSRSVSKPYYSSNLGRPSEREPLTKEERDLFKQDSKKTVDQLNDEYRRENPTIAFLDDSFQFLKNGAYVGIALLISWTLADIYSKTK